MAGLASQLARLQAIIERDHPELLPSMKPGATDAEIETLKREVTPFGVPADLETLYRWHNGCGALIYNLLPIHQVIADRRELDHFRVELGMPPTGLRIFDDGSGGWEFVDLDLPDRAAPPTVYEDFSHGYLPYAIYDSLSSMIATICAGIEAGALQRHPFLGFEHTDTQEYFTEIVPALNPGASARVELDPEDDPASLPDFWRAALDFEKG